MRSTQTTQAPHMSRGSMKPLLEQRLHPDTTITDGKEVAKLVAA